MKKLERQYFQAIEVQILRNLCKIYINLLKTLDFFSKKW